MTSRRWLQTLGARTAKVVFSFSLLLTCFSWGAGDYDELQKDLQGKTAQEAAEILRREHESGRFSEDKELLDAVGRATRRNNRQRDEAVQRVRDLLDLRALEEAQAAPDGSASKTAEEIKQNPLYRDPGVQQQANWLTEAARRLERLMSNRGSSCSTQENNAELPSLAWLTPLIWMLLGSALLALLYFVFRHFAWTRTLSRKSRTLLDEDEPERTLDEYLQLADKLASEQRFREAVRCLYLACLLRLDEEHVIRFHRGQTNWEHLARFENSPKRPPGLDLKAPTQAFDLIWYGMRPAGLEDVEKFRRWYQQVVASVRAVAA